MMNLAATILTVDRVDGGRFCALRWATARKRSIASFFSVKSKTADLCPLRARRGQVSGVKCRQAEMTVYF